MNFNNFLRNTKLRQKLKSTTICMEKEIICETSDIKECVSRWLYSEGWKYKDFIKIVKLIGIEMPIVLKDYNQNENSFKCVISCNTEIKIILHRKGEKNLNSCISITKENETRVYQISYNSGINEPTVNLKSRELKCKEKNLYSIYDQFLYNILLNIDEKHHLKINLKSFELNLSSEDNKKLIMKFEEYLLNLNNYSLVSDVYEKLIEIMRFSESDLKEIDSIQIFYIEKISEEELVRSELIRRNGELHKYAILDDVETFVVSQNGDWKYFNDEGLEICYFNKKSLYQVSVKGNSEKITNTNFSKIMDYVQSRIMELMNFVK